MAEYNTLFPSGLLDPQGALDPVDVSRRNFFILNESLAFKRSPTKVNGELNTITGSPDFGTWIFDSVWVDTLRAVWLCTASGQPGTWVQVEPAYVTSFPSSPPTDYRVIRIDEDYTSYVWDGATWIETTGGESGLTIPISSEDIAGGLHHVADITARDALPDNRRKLGVLVYVISENRYYTLVNDITNSSWEERFMIYSTSTGTTPNKLTQHKFKQGDGTEIILSSVIS